MDTKSILEWIWQPHAESPITYMGHQCLRTPINDDSTNEEENHVNVLGFKGYDAEGIPWQTFFDQKTKKPLIGFSGDGDPELGSTQIEFRVDNFVIVGGGGFDEQDADFYPMVCVKDYNFEGIPQSMMPTADFGLFIL